MRFPELFPWFLQVSLWAYVLRHGHCISDTRFGDVSIALDDGMHSGGVWNEDDIVQKVTEHDEESRKNRPECTRDQKNTHIMKVSLRKSKGQNVKVLEIPDIQATNALTYDRATDSVHFLLDFKFTFEIYDHVWPWFEPTSGNVVEVEPYSKKRKSTNAARYKKRKPEPVKLDKLERVQEKRSEKVIRMASRTLTKMADLEKMMI